MLVDQNKGFVLWLTGLPCSGKTTLALHIVEELQKKGRPVEHLDGDEIRKIFPSIGFDRTSRNEHIRRMGFLAGRLEKHGIAVVASFISPYQESRDFVRKQCRDFIEVYLSTPVDICQKRDTKGLYKLALEGKIRDFTGVQEPYEPPADPELTLDTSKLSIEQSVCQILEWKRKE